MVTGKVLSGDFDLVRTKRQWAPSILDFAPERLSQPIFADLKAIFKRAGRKVQSRGGWSRELSRYCELAVRR